jgi:hypothetical protein
VGYVEGKNYERYRLLAAELVGLRVDVLVTSIAPAALAAKKATTTIPIVIVNKDANGLQREYCCFTRNLNANDARMQDRFETSVRRPGLENLDASKPASKSSV